MTPNPPQPDLLYLVHRVPYPPDKGDRIRAFHILRFLARHARVHLACLADEPVRPEVEATLRGLCHRVTFARLGKMRWARALGSFARGRTVSEGAFWSPALARTLGEWCRDVKFTAALASASSMVPYLRLPALRGTPAVIDLVDVDSLKWTQYSRSRPWPLSWVYAAEGRRLRRLEQGLPTWARAVTLVSEPEADLYRQFAAPGTVRAVTNGVDLDYFRPPADPPAEAGCVFVGAMDYFPNIDGAVWFCKEVWPRLRRRWPEARLSLVGRRPAPAVRQLAEIGGVEVVADVPDVRPHLAGAAVAVIPLRIARGLQNKVIEALALGKAVVAAPEALAALGTEPGTHLLSASTADEWEHAVGRLLGDADRRRRLGTAGRAYVEECHHWDRCLEPLRMLAGLRTAERHQGFSYSGELVL